jgi:diguanylate cyclase (GGDEF)-like protein
LSVPYGTVQLGVNTAFLPAFGSVTFIGDFITAILLFSQARALGDRPLAWLGGAYLYSAMIVVPHLLAFPGAFAAAPVIGSSASAVWLWTAWHGGFALGVVNYALRPAGGPARPVRVWPIAAGTLGLVAVMASVATVGERLLPTILVDGSYARLNTLGIAPAVLVCNVAALLLVARRWHRPSTLTIWLSVAMVASTTDVLLTLLATGRFTVGWYLARCLSLVAGSTVLCALLADFVRLFNHVAAANVRLAALSLTDPLTAIANRRSFEQRLDTEWRRAAREQLPLSLVMIDIDQFKRFNDRFGHPAGDECLRQVAQALVQQARRPWDMPARLGGEEFAVLLPQTEADGAGSVAEMFRRSIETLGMAHPDSVFRVVTISVGVATAFPYAAGESPAGLVAAADAALYAAKGAGRNRVETHVTPALQTAVAAVQGQVSAALGRGRTP